MNVYEEATYPWLAAEKEFIEPALSDHKPILGVCLGAQLLAVVLGGSARPSKRSSCYLDRTLQ
jgi:GMP synthase (glutamine-hydrolysing)